MVSESTETTEIKYCVANKLRASLNVQMLLKNFFIPSVHPSVHHNCGVISGSHACSECLLPINLDAGLYTTCRGKRVLIVIRFNATFLRLRSY